MPSDILPPPNSKKLPEGFQARVLAALMAFYMTLVMLFHTFSSHIIKKLPGTLPHDQQIIQEFSFNSIPREEFRPPSPTPSFTEAELISSVVKRLGELEEKVNTLEAKPSEMPYEKEELLNAAVYRVDALEAELIATKKVKCLVNLYIIEVHLHPETNALPGINFWLNFTPFALVYVVIAWPNVSPG